MQNVRVKTHTTAMHIYKKTEPKVKAEAHGGETGVNDADILTKCTEICGDGTGKSCAKIVLVNLFHSARPELRVRTYAIIDDQSSHSLVHTELFDRFNVTSRSQSYTLDTCSGKTLMAGRRAHGFIVESLDSQEQLNLPLLTECDMIPDNRHEIPTRDVALRYDHLVDVADKFPPLDDKAKILLLLGRDVIPAHYVLDQRLGNDGEPFAQRLKLGWVIVGETCLDGSHVPRSINAMKTFVQPNGRHSLLEPCSSQFNVSFCEPDQITLPADKGRQQTMYVS